MIILLKFKVYFVINYQSLNKKQYIKRNNKKDSITDEFNNEITRKISNYEHNNSVDFKNLKKNNFYNNQESDELYQDEARNRHTNSELRNSFNFYGKNSNKK